MKNCISCGKLLEKPEDYFNGDDTREFCLECTDANGEMMLYEEKLLQMVDSLVKNQGVEKKAARVVAQSILLKMPAWTNKKNDGKKKKSNLKIIIIFLLVFALIISGYCIMQEKQINTVLKGYAILPYENKNLKIGSQDEKGASINLWAIINGSEEDISTKSSLLLQKDGHIKLEGDQAYPVLSTKLPSFTFLNWESKGTALVYKSGSPSDLTNDPSTRITMPNELKGWKCYSFNILNKKITNPGSHNYIKIKSDGFVKVLQKGGDHFFWLEKTKNKYIVWWQSYINGQKTKYWEINDPEENKKLTSEPKIYISGATKAIVKYSKPLYKDVSDIFKAREEDNPSVIEVYQLNKMIFSIGGKLDTTYNIETINDSYFVYSAGHNNEKGVYDVKYYVYYFNENETKELEIIYLDSNLKYIVGLKNTKKQSILDIAIFDVFNKKYIDVFSEKDFDSIKDIGVPEKILISDDSEADKNIVICEIKITHDNNRTQRSAIIYKKINQLSMPPDYVLQEDSYWNDIHLCEGAATSKYIGFQTGNLVFKDNDFLSLSTVRLAGYGINIHNVETKQNYCLDGGLAHSLTLNNQIAVWVKDSGVKNNNSHRDIYFAWLDNLR